MLDQKRNLVIWLSEISSVISLSKWPDISHFWNPICWLNENKTNISYLQINTTRNDKISSGIFGSVLVCVHIVVWMNDYASLFSLWGLLAAHFSLWKGRKWDLSAEFKVKSCQTDGIWRSSVWVSRERRAIMERKNLLCFISFKDGDLASCCYSAHRKLLFQLKCAFCSLSLSLFCTDTQTHL